MVHRWHRAARSEAGQLGSILLQYPRWFFTSSENRDDDRGGHRAAARRRVSWGPSSSAVRAGSTRRTSTGRSRSWATARSRWWSSTVRRASSRACQRSIAAPSPDLADRPVPRSSRARPGRPRASRPSSGSGTSTTRTSWASGRRGFASSPAGRGDPRPLQQLLRELRRDQRARAGPAAARPPGRPAGLNAPRRQATRRCRSTASTGGGRSTGGGSRAAAGRARSRPRR